MTNEVEYLSEQEDLIRDQAQEMAVQQLRIEDLTAALSEARWALQSIQDRLHLARVVDTETLALQGLASAGLVRSKTSGN